MVQGGTGMDLRNVVACHRAQNVAAALLACRELDKGKLLHAALAERGQEISTSVANMLVKMYAKCGSMKDANKVFESMQHPDVTTWNALIFGYACNGQGEMALATFSSMLRHRQCPDVRTFVAALKACTSLAAREDGRYVNGKLLKLASLDKGKAVHFHIVNSTFESNIQVAGTLVNMYSKCGSLEDACAVFQGMKCRDVVAWTSLIAGYAENGEGEQALDLFSRMQLEGCTPDAQTYTVVLKACGNVGALELGRSLHAAVCLCGFHKDAVLLTSFVDLYGKCGNMLDARLVFDLLAAKDLVAWNALMAGYSRQGDVEQALKLFQRMRHEHVRANAVTFLCMLTVCRHAGLAEKGEEFMRIMSSEYGLAPTVEHYTCMVDMLGRANELNEAFGLMKSMPVKANAITWTIFLAACKRWKNAQLGRLAFENLLMFDDDEDAVAGAHVLMASIHRSSGIALDHHQLLKIQARRRPSRNQNRKEQSWWIDQAGQVHSFVQ